jgi:hypothetical protein
MWYTQYFGGWNNKLFCVKYTAYFLQCISETVQFNVVPCHGICIESLYYIMWTGFKRVLEMTFNFHTSVLLGGHEDDLIIQSLEMQYKVAMNYWECGWLHLSAGSVHILCAHYVTFWVFVWPFKQDHASVKLINHGLTSLLLTASWNELQNCSLGTHLLKDYWSDFFLM